MTIAWNYLSPLHRAQLKHCRPDLFNGYHVCERCGGEVLQDHKCLHCGAEHDDNWRWIKPILGQGRCYRR